MQHLRRFGLSGFIALAVVVVMIFGINPVSLLTGQVAEPLPYTTLTALEAIGKGEAGPESVVDAASREANGFWERAFRSAAVYYPPVALKKVASSAELGCGMAGSTVGTFYCPGDSTIYVDMARYGALVAAYPAEGYKAEGYLVGLAYGHHVQAALKQFDALQPLDGDQRLKLEQAIGAQAACYAGAWTKWAGLEKLLDDPAIVAAIDSVEHGLDVTAAPSQTAIPLTYSAPSPAFRKLGFDLGYAIPAAGSCRMEKLGEPA